MGYPFACHGCGREGRYYRSVAFHRHTFRVFFFPYSVGLDCRGEGALYSAYRSARRRPCRPISNTCYHRYFGPCRLSSSRNVYRHVGLLGSVSGRR